MIKKKLAAITLIMVMLVTFMPSMTFAASSTKLKVKYTVSTSSIKLTWNKISKAKKYMVYSKVKGKNYKIATIKSNKKRSLTVKKIKGKKIKSLGTKSFTMYVKALNSRNKSIKKSSTATIYIGEDGISVKPGKYNSTNKPYDEEQQQSQEETSGNPEEEKKEDEPSDGGGGSGGGGGDNPTPPKPTVSVKAIYTSDDASLILCYTLSSEAELDVDGTGNACQVFTSIPTSATKSDNWPWDNIRTKIKAVEIDDSLENYMGFNSTAYMFSTLSNADSITGAEYLKLDNVTNMSAMFSAFGKSVSCNAVPNVSNWNTSKVQNMSNLFSSYGGKEINKVPDTSSWNTTSLTNCSSMFESYGIMNAKFNVAPLVVPSSDSIWNLSKVTNFSSMFKSYGNNRVEERDVSPVFQQSICSVIPNVSKWDTSSATDMSEMFYAYGGKNITTVPDTSAWNTMSLTNCSSMFNSYAENSKTINQVPDTSKWNTTSLTNCSSMFEQFASNSTTISQAPLVATSSDGKIWNTSKVTDMKSMFKNYAENSNAINQIPDTSKWDTTSLTNCSSLFEGYAKKSTSISQAPEVAAGTDGKIWNTSKVTDMKSLFRNYAASSNNINDVPDTSKWITTSLTNCSSMFENYASSSTVLDKSPLVAASSDGKIWNTSQVTDMSSMFSCYGASATNLDFYLDLSLWDSTSVTSMDYMFRFNNEEETIVGPNYKSWMVIIPIENPNGKKNEKEKFYGCNDSTYALSFYNTNTTTLEEFSGANGADLAETVWPEEE